MMVNNPTNINCIIGECRQYRHNINHLQLHRLSRSQFLPFVPNQLAMVDILKVEVRGLLATYWTITVNL